MRAENGLSLRTTSVAGTSSREELVAGQKIKLSTQGRKALSNLRKLLGSTDLEVLKQAHQLLLSCEESGVLETLAECSSIDDQGHIIIGPEVTKRAKAPLRTWVALAVLQAANRLSGVKTLVLGQDFQRVPMIDLEPLRGATDVKVLDIQLA